LTSSRRMKVAVLVYSLALLSLGLLPLVVPQATSRSSASCLCDMEVDWVFDYGRTNTSITMRTTIHPGAGTWSSYSIHLPPSIVGYTAFDASTNAILSLTSVQELSKVTTIIDFGGPKGDGWTYCVKFVDTGGGINENKLTDYWDWKSTSYRLAHVFHLWLPTAYDVSTIVPARNYTITTLQGRVYVSFSGNAQANETYEWTLVARRLTGPPSYPVTVTTIAAPATSLATTLPLSPTTVTQPPSTETVVGPTPLVQLPLETLGLVGLVAALAVISSTLVLARRRKPPSSAVALEQGGPQVRPPAAAGEVRYCVNCGAEMLADALYCPVCAATAGPVSDKTLGLERLEHAAIQANVMVRHLEVEIGEDATVELQMINAGKSPATLVKIENVVPEGFELVSGPEPYRLDRNHLHLKGRRLDAMKTEEMVLVLRPKRRGAFVLKPKIFYLDEDRNYRIHEPDPVTIRVKEIGLSGWIKGPE